MMSSLSVWIDGAVDVTSARMLLRCMLADLVEKYLLTLHLKCESSHFVGKRTSVNTETALCPFRTFVHAQESVVLDYGRGGVDVPFKDANLVVFNADNHEIVDCKVLLSSNLGEMIQPTDPLSSHTLHMTSLRRVSILMTSDLECEISEARDACVTATLFIWMPNKGQPGMLRGILMIQSCHPAKEECSTVFCDMTCQMLKRWTHPGRSFCPLFQRLEVVVRFLTFRYL